MSDPFSTLTPADRELATYALQRGYLTREALARCLARAPGAPLVSALAQAGLPPTYLADLRRAQLGAPDPALAPTLRPSAAGGPSSGPLVAPHAATQPPPSSGAGPPLPLRTAPATGVHADSGRLPSAADGLQRVGRYVIERELARGGMGVVYVAQDPSLGRKVALKLLLGHDLGLLERFEVEANAVAKLKHPHVVAIHEVGTDGGRPFLAMDLIEGRSLKDRIDAEGACSNDEAADLLAKLADAVYHAHTRSVLHRDLKPHNVLLDRAQTPYLTDFGLAKDISKQGEGLTVAGQAMGTPAYMSPEQADGHLDRIDRRTDVYGLGATLYEVLTGEPPFDGSTTLNVITKVLTKPPTDPRELNRAVDGDLATIVLKCLEKEPDQRYDSARDVALDLRRYLAGEAIHARPVGLLGRVWRRARRNPRVVGGAALAGLALVAALAVSTLLGFRAADQASEVSRLEQTLRQEAESAEAKARADEAAAKLSESRAQCQAQLEGAFASLRAGDAAAALDGFVAAATLARALPAADAATLIAARRGAEEALSRLSRGLAGLDDQPLPRCAVAADGTVLAGGGADGRLIVRSLAQRWEPRAISLDPAPDQEPHHRADVVALTPAGDVAVTVVRRSVRGVAPSYRLVAHELPSGRERWSWDGAAEELKCLALAPDGLVAVGTHTHIRFFRLDDGQLVVSLDSRGRSNAHLVNGQPQPQSTADLAFSSDGVHLLAAHLDGTYTVWEWRERRCLVGNYPYPGHAVTGVAWVGRDLATANVAGLVDVWRVGGQTLRRQRLLNGQSGPVKVLRWAPRAQVLLAACGNGDLWLWDAEGTPLQRLRHSEPLEDAAISADAAVLVAGGQRHASLYPADAVRRFPGRGPLGVGSGRHVVYLTGDPNDTTAPPPVLRAYDRERAAPADERGFALTNLPTFDYALALSPDDRQLVVSQYRQVSGGRYLFNGWLGVGDPGLDLRLLGAIREGDESPNPRPADAPYAWISALEISPDGRWLATGRWNPVDGSAIQVASPLGIWRRDGERLTHQGFLDWHTVEITSLSFVAQDQGGELLASGSLDGTVVLWRWDGQRWLQRRRLEVHSRMWLAAADQSNRQPPNREARALNGVLGCALSPDGTWLAIGLASGALELWPVADFDRPGPAKNDHAGPPRTLSQAPARIVHCRFLADGRLVSADGSGGVQIWGPEAGRVLRTYDAGDVITAADARQSARYTTIAAATADDHVWVWDAATPRLDDFADDPAGAVARARAKR